MRRQLGASSPERDDIQPAARGRMSTRVPKTTRWSRRSGCRLRPTSLLAGCCFVLLFCGSSFGTSLATPLPPHARVSDISSPSAKGVWRITKLSSLLGPTPAILLYKQTCRIYKNLKPRIIRTTVHVNHAMLQLGRRTSEWFRDGLGLAEPNLAYRLQRHRQLLSAPSAQIASGDSSLERANMWQSSRNLGQNGGNESAGTLETYLRRWGYLPQKDPAESRQVTRAARRVFASIAVDPRLRAQRMRDTRTMLGAGRFDLSSLSYAHRGSLEETLEVMWDHIRKSRIDKDDSRAVQELVLASIERR